MSERKHCSASKQESLNERREEHYKSLSEIFDKMRADREGAQEKLFEELRREAGGGN